MVLVIFYVLEHVHKLMVYSFHVKEVVQFNNAHVSDIAQKLRKMKLHHKKMINEMKNKEKSFRTYLTSMP